MSTNGASNPPAEKNMAADQNTDLSKDQVGWYFVEQYYNTVSKNPEKLHLFYGKKSQFVNGVEAEVAKISIGRQSIQERIKQLDFQDCKVRISNVDTQSSYDNIVIQVIGEFSNKGGEPKKFVQTFILAQQPSGYFVLNDILRSIDENDSEEEPAEAQDTELAAESAAAAPEEAPEVEPTKVEEPAAEAPVAATLDAGAIDKKLEEVGEAPQTETPTTESVTEPAEPSPEVAENSADKPTPAVGPLDPEVTVREIAEEDAKEPEKPQDPSPTPVAPKAAPPEPEKPVAPAAPPKPMTWASRLAASTGGAPRPPVVPLKASTPPATSQARAPVPPQPTQAKQSSQAAPPIQPAAGAQAADGPAHKTDANEWQTAGENPKRQNRPQSTLGASGDKESTSCYVKYVSEKVQQDDLKAALGVHGELTYFDINRPKNCAFVEYATASAYQAAIAASPYTVNGENVTVEARRKPGGYSGSGGYGPGRGGASGRGRGGFEGGRSGSQGGRGGFGSQGGRGRGAPRGSRGSAQVGGS